MYHQFTWDWVDLPLMEIELALMENDLPLMEIELALKVNELSLMEIGILGLLARSISIKGNWISFKLNDLALMINGLALKLIHSQLLE